MDLKCLFLFLFICFHLGMAERVVELRPHVAPCMIFLLPLFGSENKLRFKVALSWK